MLKKLLSGIIFGAGFTIAALCVYTGWILYVLPPLLEDNFTSQATITENPNQAQELINTPKFHELPLEEKIKLATAIIIIKFEEGENGT